MSRFKYLTVFAVALGLSACEPGHEGAQIGTLIGAGGGALIGSQVGGGGPVGFLAIVGGTLAGAWLGHEIGGSLDHKDRMTMERNTQQALTSSPAGKKSTWRNPDSGNSGTVTPQRIFTNNEGLKCREYQQTVSADGKTRTAYATACQQPNGEWRVVSNR